MRISRISVYQLDLPYVGGSYDWAKGKSVTVADSTIVRIDTDSDIYGVGEVCPLPVYLPSYPGGVRAGLAELGPQLIGLDPTRVATTFAVGVITIGHAPADALDELIRVTRSGGYLIFSIRVDREPETGYLDKLDALEHQQRWHRTEMTAPFQSLPLAEPEVIHRVCVYQVT